MEAIKAETGAPAATKAMVSTLVFFPSSDLENFSWLSVTPKSALSLPSTVLLPSGQKKENEGALLTVFAPLLLQPPRQTPLIETRKKEARVGEYRLANVSLCQTPYALLSTNKHG